MKSIHVTNQELFFYQFKVFVGDDRVSDSIDGEGISNISSIRYINLSKFESSIVT